MALHLPQNEKQVLTCWLQLFQHESLLLSCLSQASSHFSFLSIPNPPSPNGFLLPLLFFISLVTFPSSRLLSQHLLSRWYMSHMQPIGENTQLSKMEWHSHLTHLVIFTSMRLLPLLLNRKLPKDWNCVLTHFCTALDALHLVTSKYLLNKVWIG